MPWIKNENQEMVYRPSLYAKEELPTWNEVYNEWYKKKLWEYDKTNPNHQELDLYWKIPRKKFFMGVICNQFNKMLMEDAYLKKKLLDMVREKIYPWKEHNLDVKFICEHSPVLSYDDFLSDEEFQGLYHRHCILWNRFFKEKNLSKNSPPPIYTIPLPNGNQNPFITNTHPRINLAEMTNGRLTVHPIIGSTYKDSFHVYEPFPNDNDKDNKDAMKIIDFMIQCFKEYFENNIGWKDDNGNLTESTFKNNMYCGSGVDPAL